VASDIQQTQTVDWQHLLPDYLFINENEKEYLSVPFGSINELKWLVMTESHPFFWKELILLFTRIYDINKY